VVKGFEKWKRDETCSEEMKKVMNEEEDENNDDKVVSKIGFKNKVKREENSWLLTTNYSTNHVNLLVIVTSHGSLGFTNSWFQEILQSIVHKIVLHI